MELTHQVIPCCIVRILEECMPIMATPLSNLFQVEQVHKVFKSELAVIQQISPRMHCVLIDWILSLEEKQQAYSVTQC